MLVSHLLIVESLATVVTDYQHTLKGIQVEIRIRVLCALGKTGKTDSDRYFEKYEMKDLHLPIH